MNQDKKTMTTFSKSKYVELTKKESTKIEGGGEPVVDPKWPTGTTTGGGR
jgi:hypothetical protein